MNKTLLGELRRIQQLSVNELRSEWSRLNDGEPCRSRNRPYLVKRLCWRVQELRLGGLSECAKERITELAPDGFTRARTPDEANVAAVDAPTPPSRRDPRLPAPGTVITKDYKGRELRVTVRDDGFEFEGFMHGSLTALAKTITGCASINGRLFFGQSQRSRSRF